jgi:hypothetical protein
VELDDRVGDRERATSTMTPSDAVSRNTSVPSALPTLSSGKPR